MSTHTVIIVPGLGDETRGLKLVTRHWQRFGLTPIVYSLDWKNKEETFELKLQRLLTLIDSYTKKGNSVSLIGTSAGGSAILNAFLIRRNKLHRVITVCSRLRTGPRQGFRSFENRTQTSPAFAQSVTYLEENVKTLTKPDREKIMTVRAFYGDELVPSATVSLDGAYNVSIPTCGHALSISLMFILFSRKMTSFLS